MIAVVSLLGRVRKLWSMNGFTLSIRNRS